jgi:hypothetical protein
MTQRITNKKQNLRRIEFESEKILAVRPFYPCFPTFYTVDITLHLSAGILKYFFAIRPPILFSHFLRGRYLKHSIFVVRGLELFSDLLRFQDRICTNFLSFVVLNFAVVFSSKSCTKARAKAKQKTSKSSAKARRESETKKAW